MYEVVLVVPLVYVSVYDVPDTTSELFVLVPPWVAVMAEEPLDLIMSRLPQISATEGVALVYVIALVIGVLKTRTLPLFGKRLPDPSFIGAPKATVAPSADILTLHPAKSLAASPSLSVPR
jgi:hypothetical protein